MNKRRQGKPFTTEILLFAIIGAFFFAVAGVYAWAAEYEPVGTTGFALLGGFSAIIAGHLWLVRRRVALRPEDDFDGEIHESAGEIGTFAPHSWWPLVLGIAAALAFLGAAIGWWITGIGAVLAVIGLVGHLFEFSRGQHAH